MRGCAGKRAQALGEGWRVFRRLHATGRGTARVHFGRRGGAGHLRQLRKAARSLVHAQFAQAGKATGKAVEAPCVQIEGHGRVAADGGQRAAQARQIGVFQKAFAQTALFALVRARKHMLEVAVLGDEAQGGLFAHAGHAGDVVGSIAHQALDVDQLRGSDAVGLPHPRGGDALRLADAALGVQNRGVLPGELEGIAVAGDEQGLHAHFLALAGEGAQNVVGLKALAFDDAQAHALKKIADDGVLLAQFLGHGLAVGLVAVVEIGAEGVLAHVESHRRRRGRFLVQHAQKHHHKAVYGVGGRAVRRGHGRGERVKGAVHEAVSVQQHQLFRHNDPPSARDIRLHVEYNGYSIPFSPETQSPFRGFIVKKKRAYMDIRRRAW